MSKLARIVSILLFCGLVLPQKTFAQSKNNTITIAPAYQEVILTKPGEAKDITITITNDTTTSLSLELFPIDFKQTDPFGRVGFLGESGKSYSYSLSSFLSFDTTTLELSPKERRTIHVQASNRDDLSPGGHYAAVVAKVIAKDNTIDKTVFTPSVSSLIFLRKTGGERFNLSLLGTDWNKSISFSNPDSLQLQFQNEGNIHLTPYGLVQIYDMFHRELYRGQINTSSFLILPESRRYMMLDLQKMNVSLPISLNTITILGHDSLNKVHFSYQESFLYISPVTVIFVLGIIALLSILKHKKRKKQ